MDLITSLYRLEFKSKDELMLAFPGTVLVKGSGQGPAEPHHSQGLCRLWVQEQARNTILGAQDFQ